MLNAIEARFHHKYLVSTGTDRYPQKGQKINTAPGKNPAWYLFLLGPKNELLCELSLLGKVFYI